LQVDREAERESLGLRAGVPTGVVLFGGEGSTDILKVVRALNRPGNNLQLIVLCGRHREVAAELRGMSRHIPIHVEGFTRDIPRFMALSDFFIGKPGPGSMSEALAMGLPLLVERNVWTLAQERYNAEWVVERDLGIVTSDLGRCAGAVRKLLAPENYVRFRANALAARSKAVFEIPVMLERLLERHYRGIDLSDARMSGAGLSDASGTRGAPRPLFARTLL
jgi:1,2-diacylglycerol 3-beta-galactosyltransferase